MAIIRTNNPIYDPITQKWIQSNTFDTNKSQQVTTIIQGAGTAAAEISSKLEPLSFNEYYDQLINTWGPGSVEYLISEYFDLKCSVISSSSKPQRNIQYGGYNPYKQDHKEGAKYNNIYNWSDAQTALPNCVSWVAARVIELMIATELASSKNPNLWNNNMTSETDSLKYKYSISDITNFTNCGSGAQFYLMWPFIGGSSSNYNTTLRDAWRERGWGVGQEPRVGAVVCWRNAYESIDHSVSRYGGNGHAAFVEKILDQGTDKESIIVSESGITGSTQTYKKLVWLSQCYKNAPRGKFYRSGLDFSCFCYSPICDLIQAYHGSTGLTIAPTTTSIPINEPSQEAWDKYYSDVEKQKQFAAYGTNGEALENLKKNDKVEVQFLGGNEKLDGTGKTINRMGLQAVIKKDWGSNYKYQYELGLWNDNKLISVGYFDRGSLKKLP